ncbi:MAG TPA: hypothetical protein VLL74_07920, partial [Methanoregula sp.]|nr:hypothetical protein [Methanoregula sp.]
MAAPPMTSASAGTGSASGSEVLFSARPSALSYLYRYLLSFTPVLLVLVCIGARKITDSLFPAGSPTVPALFPVPSPTVSGGSSAAMAQYREILNVSIPGFGDLVPILILLVVPVGIFLLGAGIGSSLRRTVVWSGPVLTLILSACAAYVLAGSVSPTLPYLLLFLQWIAFLVQPFSIVASVLVLSGTEL